MTARMISTWLNTLSMIHMWPSLFLQADESFGIMRIWIYFFFQYKCKSRGLGECCLPVNKLLSEFSYLAFLIPILRRLAILILFVAFIIQKTGKFTKPDDVARLPFIV